MAPARFERLASNTYSTIGESISFEVESAQRSRIEGKGRAHRIARISFVVKTESGTCYSPVLFRRSSRRSSTNLDT